MLARAFEPTLLSICIPDGAFWSSHPSLIIVCPPFMPHEALSAEILRQLEDYLQSWGLQPFHDEAAYYDWQKQALSAADLSSLHHLSQLRKDHADPSADIQFYDFAATPNILPILYSQRYDFFCRLGLAIAERLTTATRVLDFGCGVGILTTFWATLFPDSTFVGIDRSPNSIAVASEQAAQRGLSNIRFEHVHIPDDELIGEYDCLISTHVLFQAENDPGLCSRHWSSFERGHETSLQQQGEDRTGVGARLEVLCRLLSNSGKILLCEKARHLGRKILLQRAVARRGFQNRSEPLALTYTSINERIEDGPLYEIDRGKTTSTFQWDEQPECSEGQSLYVCSGSTVNHVCSALGVRLPAESQMVGGNVKREVPWVEVGNWGGAMSYGVLCTPQGFQGLIWGGLQEEPLLVQSLKRFETMTKEEVVQSVQHIWGLNEQTEEAEPIPCYENHTSAAQTIWESLPDRSIQEEKTFNESDGRSMHIELGAAGPFRYVYWANTYDQRQLIMADALHADWLVSYYRSSLAEMQAPVTP